MTVLSSLYLFNLLCAIVPCDPTFPTPEINNNIQEIQSNDLSTADPESGRSLRRDLVSSTFNRIFNISPYNGNNEKTQSESPRVKLSDGSKIEGYFMKSFDGKKIYAFEGIPFAEAPIGQRRFQPPVPAKKWNGIFQAKKQGSICLQLNPLRLYRTLGNENCLYINIYSSKIPGTIGHNNPSLPVLIWIHGGAFLYGSGGEYGPSYLLNKEIVLVSFNYRLGVLGFMSTGDSVVPGNMGLKDQQLAIKWVYDNIESFGGNKSHITLIGHSAGGASVHFHLLNSISTKYFQGAASISGTGLNYWALSNRARSLELTSKLATRLNCPKLNGNTKDEKSSIRTLNCLKKRNPVLLVSNQMNLLEWGPIPITLFTPVLEIPGPNSFLTQSPFSFYDDNDNDHGNATGRGLLPKIPWMTSLTKDEGYFHLQFIYGFLKISEFRSKWTSIAPILFEYQRNPEAKLNHTQVTSRIFSQYYPNAKNAQRLSYEELSKPISDRFFVKGFYDSTLAHSKIGPTYSYLFNYRGKYNTGNFLGIESRDWGIGHAEDIFYIFNSSTLYSGFKNTDPEAQMSRLMVDLIVGFAQTRQPIQLYNIESQSAFNWKPINYTQPEFLLIDNQNIRMIKDPFKSRIEFWDSINFDDEV